MHQREHALGVKRQSSNDGNSSQSRPTWCSVFPVRLPIPDWIAPVAESTYDLREEDWLSVMLVF